jgi:hypothetical protein
VVGFDHHLPLKQKENKQQKKRGKEKKGNVSEDGNEKINYKKEVRRRTNKAGSQCCSPNMQYRLFQQNLCQPPQL